MSEGFDLTIEDFRAANVDDHVGEHQNYAGLFSNLSSVAKHLAESDPKSSAVLRLLADVASMSIDADSLHMPLVPFWKGANGESSAHLDCFSPEELNFLQEIVPEITDIFLNARIHDLLWIRTETRNILHARSAIAAYRQFPLMPENSFTNRNGWERGIRIARQIGKGAEDRIEDFRSDLLGRIASVNAGEDRYAMDLCELLHVCGIERSQVTLILDKLEFLIAETEKAGDSNWLRGHCEQAISWYSKGNRAEDVCRLTVKIAESWVSYAESMGSAMASGSHYASAIEAYRGIPKEFREQFGVVARLKELHQQMNESYRQSLSEMGEIRTEGFDISEWMELSRQHVAGKDLPDAIRSFVNLHSISDFKKLEEQAKKDIGRFPFMALIGGSTISHDGRVIAKTPGLDLGGVEANNAAVILKNMMFHQNHKIGLVVQGVIYPALEVINQEHRITEGDLLFLCQNSAIVPRGRAGIWAKGLYYGFEEKFIESTHILPFQVEHWIRVELKMRNHKTTVFKDGVETETGLSNLLGHPNISEVLNEDLLFELQAILTNHLGPNYRNNVAHGLFDPREGLSVNPIYLWWLCLKLMVCNISWRRSEKEPESGEGSVQ